MSFINLTDFLKCLVATKKIPGNIKRYIQKIFKRVVFEIRFAARYRLRMDTDDRKILEQIILPFFSNSNSTKKILFVGCEWYTKIYGSQFNGKEFWTIEPDITKKRYGGKKHVVDRVINARKYFPDSYFDLIIMNGVIGFGLNDAGEIEGSFEKCFNCLREGGQFILGWNDLPERKMFELDKSKTMEKFKKHLFKPLDCSTYYTKSPTRHVYSFFEK